MYAYLWQPKVPYVWSCCCVSHLRFCIIPYCVRRPRPLLNSPLCPRCPYSDSMPGGNESVRFFPPDIVFRLSMLLLVVVKVRYFQKKSSNFIFVFFWRIFILGASNITENVCQKWQKLDLTSFFENTPPIEQQSRALKLLESWSYIPESEPL